MALEQPSEIRSKEKYARTDRVTQALLSELSGSRETIAVLLKSSDQIMTIGGTLLVAVSVVLSGLFKQQRSEFPAIVLALVPFLFGLLATYLIRIRTVVSCLGGYKAAVEECLMSFGACQRAVLWESSGSRFLKGRFGYALNVYCFFGAFIVVLIVSAIHTTDLFDQFSEYVQYLYWSMLVIMCIILFLGYLDSAKAHDDTRRHFLRILIVSIGSDDTLPLRSGGEKTE